MPDRYTRSSGVLHRRLEDEMILVHLDTDRTWHLNPTAADIWELLETRRSEVELAEDLCDRYAVPVDELLPDVQAMLAALEDAGLIEVESAR
jgi:hypothetical protein